jgi:DnaJ-domain-containing protein 1
MANASCPFCGKALGDGFLSRHVCPSCGKLGVPEAFRQDTALLQKHFYEASRVLHPDRFTSAGPDSRSFSLERMSLVNEAYRTLKNPEELRDYILKLRGNKSEEKAKMPLDLAESWFELQDSLVDDPGTATDKLRVFEKELGVFKEQAEAEILALELAYDQTHSETERAHILKDLARKTLELNYLKSMDRDVERIKKK